MARLSNQALSALSHLKIPGYERGKLHSGLVHIGLGGFHRAHQAAYTEAVLNQGDLRWGTIGASLRSTGVADALKPQDYLYTVVSLDQQAQQEQQAPQEQIDLQIHGGLIDIVTSPEALLAVLEEPVVKVVTLTITEKGYTDESASGVPSLLAQALARRMALQAPITLVSCDNLLGNGEVLAARVMAHCEDSDTRAWVQDNVAFPSTMVDRITPAATPADRQRVMTVGGYEDSAPVICEPFSQWVIEDHFVDERPAWEVAGAQLVGDVTPYEQAKLRILNASHSLFAYLGLLQGYEFIHQAVADADLRRFAEQTFVHEIRPFIVAPPGLSLDDYFASVLERFANQAVPYRTTQVATDGSQKIPQRILPSAQAAWQRGEPAPHLTFVLAAWLRTLAGAHAVGQSLEYEDAGAQQARTALSGTSDVQDHIAAIQATSPLLAGIPDQAVPRLGSLYTRIAQHGVVGAMQLEGL